MNVLALLEEELKGKNWSLAEKTRYLYLRSCELFSYDPKYDCYNFLPNEKENKKKIRNRTIDLEDVTDFNVVCTSHSWEVYAKLLAEILNVVCKKETFINHGYCTFDDGMRRIDADATVSLDISRVKLGLTTGHYLPLEREEDDNQVFNYQLKRMDRKIGYIKEEYHDSKIKSKKEALNQINIHNSYTEDEFLLYKMNMIKELFNHEYKMLTNYSDASFCADYLQIKFLQNEEAKKVTGVSLFQDYRNNPWEFLTVYLVELQNEKVFYLLEQDNEKTGYSLSEITREDAINYTNTMKGDDIEKDCLKEKIKKRK